MEALRHKTIGQIACGSGHTVILTNDGEVDSTEERVHRIEASQPYTSARYVHTGVVVGPRGRRAIGPQRLQLEVRAAAGQGAAGTEHQAGGLALRWTVRPWGLYTTRAGSVCLCT